MQTDHNNEKRKRKPDSSLLDFTITPKDGVLSPMEKKEVVVQFTPTKAKKYDYELQLKVGLSVKPIILAESAMSYRSVIKIEPDVLKIAPVLPYSEGAEVRFTIENSCNYPCEVYSLEFDKQYKVEDDMLKTLPGFDAQGQVFYSPDETYKTALLVVNIKFFCKYRRN